MVRLIFFLTLVLFLSSCTGLIPISDIEDDIYTNSSDFKKVLTINDNAEFAQKNNIPNPDDLEYEYYDENDARTLNNNSWGSSIIYDPFFGTYSTCNGFGYRYGFGYNYNNPFYSGFGNPYLYGYNNYNPYNRYNSYNSYWGNPWYNNNYPVVINNLNHSETKNIHYQPRSSRTGYSARGVTNSYNRRKSTNTASNSNPKAESVNTENKNSISQYPTRTGNRTSPNSRTYSSPNRSRNTISPNTRPSTRNSNNTGRNNNYSSPLARPSSGSSGRHNSGSNRGSTSPNSRRR